MQICIALRVQLRVHLHPWHLVTTLHAKERVVHRDECTESPTRAPELAMGSMFTIEEAARACGVSRDTIKRRLRSGQFPGACRAEPQGNRPPPWLIPAEDLLAANLRPLPSGTPTTLSDDPEALRLVIAHHEALALAREAHLLDLRTEIRRLHDHIAQLLGLAQPDAQQAQREGGRS